MKKLILLTIVSILIIFNTIGQEIYKVSPENSKIEWIGEKITSAHSGYINLQDAFFIIEEGEYEVELFKDYYVNKDMLSNLKSTNRILNVVAGVYAEENGYANCLLVNTDKKVVEAINGNLFLVKGNEIKTPPLSDGCLDGIIRKNLMKIIAGSEEYDLVEDSISPFELQKVDELFITNSIVGIKPISKYRKKEYESKVAKSLVGKLNAKARIG